MAIFGLFTLVALLVLALLLSRGLRRRPKKDDDAFEFVREEPNPSLWILILLLGLTLLPLGLAGYVLWMRWTPFKQDGVAGPASATLGRHLIPPASQAAIPTTDSPFLSGAIAVLALVAGLAALGVVLWIYFGSRPIGGWVGPSARAREGLVEAVEESLESMRREPDPRRAIIMCYRCFEQVMARSGLARAPWKTPMEFLQEARRRVGLPSDSVATLTRLFEVSRFSQHPVEWAERDAAVGSLVEIKKALNREDSRGSVA
jgi:hypothetical protein